MIANVVVDCKSDSVNRTFDYKLQKKKINRVG